MTEARLAGRLVVATDAGVYGADGVAVALAGRPVTTIVAAGPGTSADDGWWALVEGRTVWRGQAGQPPEQRAEIDGPPATCLLPVGDRLLVGTEQARVLWLAAGGSQEPVAGFEQAPGRERWYTPWGGPPAVRSLAADADAVYVNVHVGGIVRLRDGVWQATIDIDADVHQVATVAGRPGLVVAASARGLAVSDDHGDSWRLRAEGLHASYCRAVAIADGTLHLSASTGPSTSRSALYRGDLDGEALERCTAGLPDWLPSNVDTGCVAAAAAEVAFGTKEGDLYLSGDRGVSWRRLCSGLPPVRALAAA